MKLLFDQNISFRLVRKLQTHFPGCIHVSDCKLSNSEDPDIWEYAMKNDMAIVTHDSDFYDISIINGHPPKIIWVRTGNLKTNELARLFVDNYPTIYSFLNDNDLKDFACLELEKG